MNLLNISIPEYRLKDGRCLFHEQEVFFPGNGLYLLKGKNGSGKTTLFSFLTGQIDRKDSKLIFCGQEIDTKNQISYYDSFVSYLPQDPLVFTDKTLLENILFPYEEKNEEKAVSLMISLGLKDCMGKAVSSLSFGEKQRLVFARMLYHPKKILLLDEIDSGLDEESASILKACILRLKEEHIVIFSTQLNRYDDVEDAFVYEISDGKISLTKQGYVYGATEEKNPILPENSLIADGKRILKNNHLFFCLLSFSVLICNILFLVCGSAFCAFHDTEQKNRFAFDNIVQNSHAFLVTETGYESIRNDLTVEESYPVLDPSNHAIGEDYGAVGSCLSGMVALDDYSSMKISEGRVPERENEVLVSDVCFKALRKKYGILLSEHMPLPMLSEYLIVGTYQSKHCSLDSDYLKTLTDDGKTFTYYRSMYLFMTETVFVYQQVERVSDYLIVNNGHTDSLVKPEMVSRLSTWNERILLNDHLTPLYDRKRFSSSAVVIFYFSLPFEGLFTIIAFFLFSHQNKRLYLYERVSGMSRKRFLLPNLTLYSLFSFFPFLLSLPISYLILRIINYLSFSSSFLLPLNYLPLSSLLCLIALGSMLLISLVFLGFLFLSLVPKKLDKQRNALKRK